MGGLSPLARGTHDGDWRIVRVCRFIPAGAGNTTGWLGNTVPVAVYPRWRGEHPENNIFQAGFHGLSPLARGTRQWRTTTAQVKRFIPAGAGNTHEYFPAYIKTAVYPRWRGEHPSECSNVFTRNGLSPLARGTRFRVTQVSPIHRFIPAGAGNTPHVYRFVSTKTVYPRWRGEHVDKEFFMLESRRFIPAGAGNTFVCR